MLLRASNPQLHSLYSQNYLPSSKRKLISHSLSLSLSLSYLSSQLAASATVQVFNGGVNRKFGIFALFRLSSKSINRLGYYLFLEMGKKEVQDKKVNYERAEAVLKLLTKQSPLSVKQVGSSCCSSLYRYNHICIYIYIVFKSKL